MRILRLIVAAQFVCFLATTAQACNYSYTQTANGFCNHCLYEATIDVARNETCERHSIAPGRGTTNVTVEYIDARISERAKHGIAGANGNVIAYHPNKDYVGKDDFVKEVVYRQNGQIGRYSVRYFVTVHQ